MNNNYKITIYNNDRIQVQKNINHFKSRNIKNRVLPTKTRNKDNPYIPTIKYLKTLKENQKKLYAFDIDPTKSVYLTLTTKNIMLWNELKAELHRFLICVKRTFGKNYYIRAIESFENDTHYHTHLIIMFENGIPKNFTELWIKKHWKLGRIDLQTDIEPYGLVDYFTEPKKENINPNNPTYTKLPQFVQIISHSKDFPKSNKHEIITNIDGVNEFIDQTKRTIKQETGQDLYCFTYDHKYIDKETGEIITCIDRQFYHKQKNK